MAAVDDRELDQRRRTEAAFFDDLVRDEGDFNPFTDRGWATLRARFHHLVAPDERVSLLDVGCGTTQSRRLYEQVAQPYVAIDLSHGALRTAKSKDGALPLANADACRLPFQSSSFDVVCFSSVLHHIMPGYDVALREALRVVKPGGRVFAFDPNLLHPAMALFRWPKSPLYNPHGVSPNERPMTSSELQRAFVAAGFVDVRQRGQADIPYRAVAPNGFGPFLGAYNVADRWLQRCGLARVFGTFIVSTARRAA